MFASINSEMRNASRGLSKPGELRTSRSVGSARSLTISAYAATLLTAMGLALIAWGQWGGLQFDFGRELYVPAQILQGKLLYRDLWYPLGPLAPYFEAMLLRAFGLKLAVLYVLGLALAIGCACLLYEIGRILKAPNIGFTAAIIFLLQAINQFYFNYVFPYAYAASLGELLSLACCLLLLRYIERRSLLDLILAGVAAGLALLSKQEMGAACYVTIAFVLAVQVLRERSLGILIRGILSCVPGAVLWIGVYGWFFWKVTPALILFHNWIEFPDTYFQKNFGAPWHARVGLRFAPRELAYSALVAVFALNAWRLLAKWRISVGVKRVIVATILFALALLLVRLRINDHMLFLIVARPLFDLFLYSHGMYFIGICFLTDLLYKLWATNDSTNCLAQATLGVFALLLSVRVLAEIVPYGYSIFYAVPLFLFSLIAFSECIRWSVAGEEPIWRSSLSFLLALEIVAFIVILAPIRSDRTVPFKSSWGTIYLTPREAASARQILAFVTEQRKESHRVLIVPELPIMYALSGTSAPNRWYTLTPGVLSPEDERDYIRDLDGHKPEFIVLTNRETSEYGVAYFGLDYDQRIYSWILGNYRVVGQFGKFQRNGDKSLAALLYARGTATSAASH